MLTETDHLARKHDYDELLHPATYFHELIKRERSLCDRHDRHFALVVFSMQEGQLEDIQLVENLAKTMERRKRFTDEAGWLDREEVGVLLPETDVMGATQFASNVLSTLPEGVDPPTSSVYAYPDITYAPHTGSADDESEPPQDTGGEIEDCLAEPPPPWKRALDLTVAALSLLLLSPLMLMIAALIKIVSPGSVFFRQERVGYMGKPFMCFKFRTMHSDAGTSAHRSYFTHLINSEERMTKLDESNDSRIIPFGKFLRMSALDELPQLINVLRGEMSIVGPRPCIPYEYLNYRGWQKQRVEATPGLTGLWQVSGKNRTTFREMMRFDINYARHKSIGLDATIMLKTPVAIYQQLRDSKKHPPDTA